MLAMRSWAPRRGRSALGTLLLGTLALLGAASGYTEEMLVHGMHGAALVHFEAAAAAPLHARHAGSFPASLLALAREQGVQQLELSITRGRWAWAQQQHAPAIGGSKPPGLEVKVAFDAAVGDTQAAYGGVAQTLGGLLCAGVATAPQLAVMAAPAVGWFTHQSPAVTDLDGHRQRQQQHGQQRQVYAWLPQEVVCSENLEAWRRLLPCRHQAGLAALLQPVQLAAASYVSLGLQLQVASQQSDAAAASSGGSKNQQQPQAQLRLVLTAVLPQPAAAEQQQQEQPSLVAALFGCSLPAACPAATSSMLYVAPSSAAQPSNSTSSCTHSPTSAGPLLACDILQQRREEAEVSSSLLGASRSSSVSGSIAPAMQVVQHVVQRGTRAGTLVVGVRTPAAALQLGSGSEPSGGSSRGLLHVMQLVPWQLPVDAASLRLELNGRVLDGPGSELVWQSVDARPDHTARIELLLRLPAGAAAAAGGSGGTTCSTCGGRQWLELTLSVDYGVAFVGVFDLPPDASRGIDIPPAVATLLPPACANASSLLAGTPHPGSGGGSTAGGTAAQPPLLRRLSAASGCRPQQQYSGAIAGWGGPPGGSGATGGGAVVPLPIPDLSMPFNVICFTSTLLAVLFGGVANVVLRSPEELAGGGEAAAQGGTPVWKRKARRLVALLLLMGALAVYLDRDLQRQLDAALHHWVLGRTRSPEQHGEL